jgi:hypothetical protein
MLWKKLPKCRGVVAALDLLVAHGSVWRNDSLQLSYLLN